MKKEIVVFVASCASSVLFGAVPDLTSSLEFVGNPTLERWSTPIQANTVMDLQVYNGKIYLGTGDWSANKGPVPLWAYDPSANAFTNELTAGTDAIEYFRVCSDGRLYAPATDPRESAETVGSMFRKELDGSWKIFPNYSKTVLPSSSGYAQLVQHVFDVEICKSHLFMSGNGVAKSDDEGNNWSRVDNYPEGVRMNSLIRCGDELFCKVDNAVFFQWLVGRFRNA